MPNTPEPPMIGTADRSRVPGARALDGWGIYLAFVVLLSPMVFPIGDFQLAALDAFNAIAICVFLVGVMTRRIAPRAPFLLGAFAILVGSLVAMVNAENVPAAILALVQDVYLYAWFVMLVSVLRVRGDLVGLRIGWVAVACGVALFAIGFVAVNGASSVGAILGPKGIRAKGTFPDPNMCADYLGMSLFVVLSLSGHMGRVLRWGAIAILLTAIVATKSNGGALSLFVGLVVWGAVRAHTARLPLPMIAGSAMLVVGLTLGLAWMTAGLGVGTRQIQELQSHSFLARASHSSEGRFKIWRQLEATLRRAPLGIGPGNSRWVPLTVEGRERPHSMYSKEAHSDYLAYLIERGPIAIVALLTLIVLSFGKVRSVWRRRLKNGTADRATSALVAAMAGALACSAVHSLTIERLHFRHFWLLMALICALAESTRTVRARQGMAMAPEPEKTGEPLVVAGA